MLLQTGVRLIDAARRGIGLFRRSPPLLAAALALALLQPAAASTQQIYVVGNDHGGYLHERLAELRMLRKNKVRVEIRGKVCYSTCTMFLGLPDTCVDPNTLFGFHGPSRSGRRLPQERFDYFSQVIAQYYPAPLKSWFMAEGRNRIFGVHKIRGSEIIRMGVSACSPASMAGRASGNTDLAAG